MERTTKDFFEVNVESPDTVSKLVEWVTSHGDVFDEVFNLDNGDRLRLITKDGLSRDVYSGDVIIRDNDSYYLCKRDGLDKSCDYDSTADTLFHIRRVSQLMGEAAQELIRRGSAHDQSKLEDPEKALFDKYTPILKTLVYGSEEYKASLAALKPALDHHYAHNSHHPEFYQNGIDGMDLFDIIEMFFDWKVAGERNKGGSILRSIDVNKDRFKMSDQLVQIFKNTADKLGYE